MLSEEFRLDYCHLWQALIWRDMRRVKEYSQRLGAGDLYPLFACMLTARSWHSVKRGIGQAPVTASEVGVPPPPGPCLLPGAKRKARADGPGWRGLAGVLGVVWKAGWRAGVTAGEGWSAGMPPPSAPPGLALSRVAA